MKIEYADKQNQFFKEMKWWEVIVVTKKWKMKNWKLKMLMSKIKSSKKWN